MTFEPNIKLLKKTVKYIGNNRKEWDQANWRCGTGMCVAGTAAFLAGAEWADPDPDGEYAEYVKATGEFADDATAATVDGIGRVMHIREYAAKVLKLNEPAADDLFGGENSLKQIRKIVKKLADPEQRELDYKPYNFFGV